LSNGGIPAAPRRYDVQPEALVWAPDARTLIVIDALRAELRRAGDLEVDLIDAWLRGQKRDLRAVAWGVKLTLTAVESDVPVVLEHAGCIDRVRPHGDARRRSGPRWVGKKPRLTKQASAASPPGGAAASLGAPLTESPMLQAAAASAITAVTAFIGPPRARSGAGCSRGASTEQVATPSAHGNRRVLAIEISTRSSTISPGVKRIGIEVDRVAGRSDEDLPPRTSGRQDRPLEGRRTEVGVTGQRGIRVEVVGHQRDLEQRRFGHRQLAPSAAPPAALARGTAADRSDGERQGFAMRSPCCRRRDPDVPVAGCGPAPIVLPAVVAPDP